MLKALPVIVAACLAGSLHAAEPAKGGSSTTAASGFAMADHVAIHVADMDASAAFYRDVFGLSVIPSAVPRRRWLDLGGGMELHIIGGRTAPAATDRSVHLALRTKDLAPVLDRLKSKGMRWQDFAGTEGAVSVMRQDGVRQIFLQDPDGYWIEVNDALSRR